MVRFISVFLAVSIVFGIGCAHRVKEPTVSGLGHPEFIATKIDSPISSGEEPVDLLSVPPPIDLDEKPEFWELSLQEAIQVSLANSSVLRDLGGTILEAPSRAATIYDPAISETDPRFGVDAALSDFDASFGANAFFENNNRALNNIFEGGGTRLFKQDLHLYNLELSKRAATGTGISLRGGTDYDYNNSPGNNVPNLPWEKIVELEVRHPLLRGGGVEFNRIAGRNSIPGFSKGVLIARLNTDISLSDFEASVRGLVSQVENAYWELYFAYRDLDAKITARGQALKVWRSVEALSAAGQLGGEKEPEAREQFFRLDADVQNALMGPALEKTLSNNFRGTGGVHATERRLRMAMGLPASDGRLIRPSTAPPMTEILFDWGQIVAEAIDRRVELRRQRWKIKRRELEVVAAYNFTKPQLDVIGAYRFRGRGHDLLRSNRNGRAPFDNAYMNLTGSDFQEWELGVDFSVPLGNRKGHAAVRNAKLQLAREKAILHEQEREIVNDLSGAISEKRRALRLAKAGYNRRLAASDHLRSLQAIAVNPKDLTEVLDLLLNAQRRMADAESSFHKSLASYAVAVKNVHFEKGSLLDFNQINLAEGPWPTTAYNDARELAASRKLRPALARRIKSRPPLVTHGEFPQNVEPAEEISVPTPDAPAKHQSSVREFPETPLPRSF